MDRQRHIADSGDKYKLYYDALRDKIEFYKIDPAHTYNMDEKGFMIGALADRRESSASVNSRRSVQADAPGWQS